MAKYKVGDKVRVRSDLKTVKMYGSQGFTVDMVEHLGKTVTITKQNCAGYLILEDDGDWIWTDEMFDGLVEEPHMSAEEVLEWLKDNHEKYGVYKSTFGKNYMLSELLSVGSFLGQTYQCQK